MFALWFPSPTPYTASPSAVTPHIYCFPPLTSAIACYHSLLPRRSIIASPLVPNLNAHPLSGHSRWWWGRGGQAGGELSLFSVKEQSLAPSIC